MRNIFIIFLFSACISPVNKESNSIKLLKGIPIHQIKELSTCFYGALYLKDYFILLDAFADKPLQVYNADFQLMASAGRKGSGPEDLEFPEFTGQIAEDNDEFYLLDRPRKCVYRISLEDLLNESFDFEKSRIALPEDLGIVKNIYFLKNGTIVGTPAMEAEGRIFIVKNNEIQWIPFPEEDGLEIRPDRKSILFGASIAIVNDNTIMACSNYFDRVEYFDLNGRLIDSIEGDLVNLIDYSDYQGTGIPPKIKRYYYQTFVSKKRVFVLNYNMTYEEYGQEKPVNTRISVFENGQLTGTIQLDQRILYFTINESDRTLIGISDISPLGECYFYKYNLNDFI